ncbi:MAG: NAD(P)/FAD-dependent oxidoreductase [Blastocatellia bacterium]|nr:NAD(P)/FAD-dependent oxidoreductase [Blastocatellia bacterium]MBN8724769.1 NAD(P)/FAD-dependent oxidoreductase [Acidobacteriota bacterium]
MSDVIIIGGGPAGSATGCFLSMAGIDNVILEAANHPRPHVGESMVTSSTRVFEELDFLKVMEEEGFVKKYGASWHPPMRAKEFAIEFAEFPQPGINQDYTYHVSREKLDLLLLKHAEKKGSKICQGVQVKDVVFDENNFVKGVQAEVAGQQVFIPCKVVVDASGRRTLLGSKLKWKKNDPIFDQYAVHSWFKNVDRGHGKTEDFIHIYFLPQDKVRRGWIWQIPITEEITSMGVVAEKEVFRNSKSDPEAWFNEHVKSTPDVAKAMENAVRIRDFSTEGDYSYCMDKFVGNGFVLIGDAARFVDPIFSSGVSVALYTAKYAAERIKVAFEQNNFSEEILAPYETKVRGGVGVWYEFIRLYYKVLPLFTYFIQKKEYRIEVLRLLQGEVYDRGEVLVLKQMREFINNIENTEGHMFKQYLTDIPID